MSKHYENQRRLHGQFATNNPQSAVAKLTVRVTPGLREEVERVAQGKVAEWVRQAIIDKLNKELDNVSALDETSQKSA